MNDAAPATPAEPATPAAPAAADALAKPAAPAAAPAPTGMPEAPAWLAGADADTIAMAQSKGWTDNLAVIKSYANLEKLFGADKAGHTVQVPGEGAEQETVDAFYNKLGRPEAADKYSVKPEDFNGVPEDAAKALQDLAHKEGLTEKQYAAIHKWNNESGAAFEAKLNENAMVESAQQETALKTEWGAAYDANLQVASEAAASLGLSKEQLDAMQIGIGYDGVMKLVHKLGVQVGEGGFIQGEGGRQAGAEGGIMAPKQAQAALNKLVSDPVFMKEWGDKTHPNHQAALNKKAQLTSWSIGQK